MVTGRFITRSAANIFELTLADGTTLVGTGIHPVWEIGVSDWVPLSELRANDVVDTTNGPLVVASVRQLNRIVDVFNIEVHGHHVYRVAETGILVHNKAARINLDDIDNMDIDDIARAKLTGQMNEKVWKKALKKGKITDAEAEEILERMDFFDARPDTRQVIQDITGSEKALKNANLDYQNALKTGDEDLIAEALDKLNDAENQVEEIKDRFDELARQNRGLNRGDFDGM